MKKNRHVFVLIALLFSLLCSPLDRVLATSTVAEVPFTIKQNFEYSNTQKEIDLTGTYEFCALEDNTPMPENSMNEKYDFILDGTNAKKTIVLQFQQGGVYRYQLVQTSKDKYNYTFDRSVYLITVYITNGDKGELIPQVIAEKNDGKKYGELEFYNSYTKDISKTPNSSKPTDPPRTGNVTNIKLNLAIALCSLLVIIMLLRSQKR